MTLKRRPDRPWEVVHDDRSFRDEEARLRSKLANERTFAAWMRTGVTVAVAGVAIAEFVVERAHPLRPHFVGLGAGFILAGALLIGFALYDYQRARVEMKAEAYRTPKRWLVAIATVMALLASALLALLLITQFA